jgi:hypothetical protein
MQAIETTSSPKTLLQDSTRYKLKVLNNGEEFIEDNKTNEVWVFEKTLRNSLGVSPDTLLRIRRQQNIGAMVGRAITGRLSEQVVLLGRDVPWVIQEVMRSQVQAESKAIAEEMLTNLVKKYNRDSIAWLKNLYVKQPLIHVGTLAKHIGVSKNQLMKPDWITKFKNRSTVKDPHYIYSDCLEIIKMFKSRAVRSYPQIDDILKAIEIAGVDNYFSRLQPNGILRSDPATEALERKVRLEEKAAEAEARRLEMARERLQILEKIEAKRQSTIGKTKTSLNETIVKIQKDFMQQLQSIQQELGKDDNLEIA